MSLTASSLDGISCIPGVSPTRGIACFQADHAVLAFPLAGRHTDGLLGEEDPE